MAVIFGSVVVVVVVVVVVRLVLLRFGMTGVVGREDDVDGSRRLSRRLVAVPTVRVR